MKKRMAYILAGIMMSSSTTAWAANNYNDIEGHWAENAITTWTDRKVLSGYNNLFRPNDTVTIGEMAVILDRIMYYTEKQQNTFSDLDQAFYTDPILKAAKAGILLETTGLARPKDAMTRQEAVVMLAKSLGITPVEGNTDFTDDEQIADWAKGYILGMKQKGYVSGSSDGAFYPESSISRAEVVTLLHSSIENMVTENTKSLFNSGKDVIINTPNVTLESTVVDKDLILSEGIGEGNVTLDNVTVKGSLIVRGGGIHTVTLKNSNISNLSIEKKSAPVRVLTEQSNIKTTNVKTPSILEGNFNTVTVSASTDVTVRGTVETMEVSAKTNLQTEGTIKSINVTASGANSIIKGTGNVENVQIAAENTSVEIANTNVVVSKAVSQAKVNGKTVKGGTEINSPSNNSSNSSKRPSGGGSSSSGNGSSGNITQENITIKNVESISGNLVRVTLSSATEKALTQNDFSIICTGAGSDMTILNIKTTDNKVYDLTTAYYRDNTYNLQVNINGKYVDKDFVVKYDCAELTSAQTKRTSESTAEFSYISDTPGTLYYAVMKDEPSVLSAYNKSRTIYATTVLPVGDQPSADYLIACGTKTDMAAHQLNTVNITDLEKDTAYILYYLGVDNDDRITPVKQIEISAEAIISGPTTPENYEIESITPHFNEKAEMNGRDEYYWFNVTFNKAIPEELTLDNFELTCPQQADLHLGRVQKMDSEGKIYNVYMHPQYFPKEKNTLTMHVTFANGNKIEKAFYFDVTPPDFATSLSIERTTDKEHINVTFKSNKDGYIYYKVYNDDDYEFDSTTTKSPDDVYTTEPIEIKAGLNSLENIPAKEGQRFCYATTLKSGQKVGYLTYSKLIENYSIATDPNNPDDSDTPNTSNNISIKSIKVSYNDSFGQQFIYIYFDKNICSGDIDDEKIEFDGFEGKKVMATALAGEEDPENPDAYYIKGYLMNFNDRILLPEGKNTIIIPLATGGLLTYDFEIGSNHETVDTSSSNTINTSTSTTKAMEEYINSENIDTINSNNNSDNADNVDNDNNSDNSNNADSSNSSGNSENVEQEI